VTKPVRGRFAPSPTGRLHFGSLVAAMGSYLSAKHQGGEWLVRIEDVDAGRCREPFVASMVADLKSLGLVSDGPVVRQSERGALYQTALDQLTERGLLYPCTCTRQQLTHIYSGTCRKPENRTHRPSALRLRLPDAVLIDYVDQHAGSFREDLSQTVGDFVLRRNDGAYAYQLAVVVDDAAQGITEVVRGRDLLDNTARQIHLQTLLGLPRPRYLHLPLVKNPDGSKLSKSSAALPVDVTQPLATLQSAHAFLGQQPVAGNSVEKWWSAAIENWCSKRLN
jgi:glutamyl-Q tRNA(Asp) synthetase